MLLSFLRKIKEVPLRFRKNTHLKKVGLITKNSGIISFLVHITDSFCESYRYEDIIFARGCHHFVQDLLKNDKFSILDNIFY